MSMSEVYKNKTAGGISFPLLLLISYIIIKPFYLLPSGLPQIADTLVIVLFLTLFLKLPGLKISNGVITSYIAGLAVIIFVVSGVWAIVLSDVKMLMPFIFFLFNFLLFLSVSHLISTEREALKYILWAITASVLLQFILLPVSWGLGFRQSLFFNNPNQLGYWTVLCATLFLFIVQHVKTSKLVYVIFTGVIIFLAGLSLSKAAMVSIILLFLLYYGNRPIVGLIFIFGMIAVFLYLGEIEQIAKIMDRLADLGSAGDDSVAGRGYDRIWLLPEYLWFGNGEGGLYRFSGTLHGAGATHELHSTIGMLFFSYGPLGLFVFLAIFIKLLFTKGLRAVLPFIPVFAYSLTHQGFRFSFFWLLLSVVSTIYLEQVPRRKYQYKSNQEANLAR